MMANILAPQREDANKEHGAKENTEESRGTTNHKPKHKAQLKPKRKARLSVIARLGMRGKRPDALSISQLWVVLLTPNAVWRGKLPCLMRLIQLIITD